MESIPNRAVSDVCRCCWGTKLQTLDKTGTGRRSIDHTETFSLRLSVEKHKETQESKDVTYVQTQGHVQKTEGKQVGRKQI